MFADWDDYHNENEALGTLKRYHEMRNRNKVSFFDIDEFENIIDYFLNEYNYKEALAAISMALDQHPYTVSIRMKYIQILIETGKPARALGIIRRVEAVEQSNYQLFLFKGIALLITGKYEEAVRDFNRAVDLASENKDEVTYNIAQSFMQIDKYDDALKYLMQSYRYNNDNYLTLYDLAQTYDKLERPKKSIYYYYKYLDIDPFAENVWNYLGMMYIKTGNFHKAFEAYDFAMAINPKYFTAYLNKADALIKYNDPFAAIGLYNEVLEQDPEHIRTLCCLADCYEEMGQYQEAIKIYDKVLQVNPEAGEAWYGKGLMYYRMKKYSTGISAIKKALVFDPVNADYWFILGEIYSRMRKYGSAGDSYRKAIEINPSDHDAWLAYAQIHFNKKKVCEAIDILSRSSQHIRENPTIHYRLAAYHAYKEEFHEAGMHFTNGLKLNYVEHQDMFRLFPKTQEYDMFYNLIERYLVDERHKINN